MTWTCNRGLGRELRLGQDFEHGLGLRLCLGLGGLGLGLRL